MMGVEHVRLDFVQEAGEGESRLKIVIPSGLEVQYLETVRRGLAAGVAGPGAPRIPA